MWECIVSAFHTHFGKTAIRTNTVIDERLLAAAMKAGDFKIKKAGRRYRTTMYSSTPQGRCN